MQAANQNADILNNPEQVKSIANIMKTNVSACVSIGTSFIVQLARIYMDLLNVYRATSELISISVQEGGVIQTKTPKVRGLRTIKKEILKLIQTYILGSEEHQVILDNLVPPLLDIVLGDYSRNVEPARDFEVLTLMSSVIQKLGSMMTDKISIILESVFECTLNMINKDFQEYPEHRVAFFNLLLTINQNCFSALLELPSQTFKLILDSVVWAFKHTMRDIADTGLQICQELLNNVLKLDPQISGAFFQSYYIQLFQDVFYVLSDGEHKSGFKYQVSILAQLCHAVESGSIVVPLSQQNTDNREFIREYLKQLLLSVFPNLQPYYKILILETKLIILYQDCLQRLIWKNSRRWLGTFLFN
jgi:exportin-1